MHAVFHTGRRLDAAKPRAHARAETKHLPALDTKMLA